MIKNPYQKILFFMTLALMGTLTSLSLADIPDNLSRGMQKVIFSKGKDIDTVEQAYPFVKEELQRIKEVGQMIKDSAPPAVHIAEMNDPDVGVNLFFVNVVGPLYCGTHGCSMYVYADEGKGYKKALEITATGSVRIAKNFQGSKLSLFFDTPRNYSRWDLNEHDHTFKVFNPPPEADQPWKYDKTVPVPHFDKENQSGTDEPAHD